MGWDGPHGKGMGKYLGNFQSTHKGISVNYCKAIELKWIVITCTFDVDARLKYTFKDLRAQLCAIHIKVYLENPVTYQY